MISKHSHEQSDRGEGVEVVQNEPFEDPEHGQGQFTEKRVYLNRSGFLFTFAGALSRACQEKCLMADMPSKLKC